MLKRFKSFIPRLSYIDKCTDTTRKRYLAANYVRNVSRAIGHEKMTANSSIKELYSLFGACQAYATHKKIDIEDDIESIESLFIKICIQHMQ